MSSNEEKELYQRVDEVLYYLWDSIGVAHIPQARDEYYSYLPHVYGLLLNQADVKKVAGYLGQIRTSHMGLPPMQDQDLDTAEILIEWRDAVLD